MAEIKKLIIVECVANNSYGFDGFKSFIDNGSYNRFLGEQIDSEIEDYHTCDEGELEFSDFRVVNAGDYRHNVCKSWCDGLQELLGSGCGVYYKTHTPFEIYFTLSLPIDLLNEILCDNVMSDVVVQGVKSMFGENGLLCGFMDGDYIKWKEWINEYCETGIDKSPKCSIDKYIWLSMWYWLKYIKFDKDEIDYSIEQRIGEDIDFGFYIELTESGNKKIK